MDALEMDRAVDRAAELRDAELLRADTEPAALIEPTDIVTRTDALTNWLCSECMDVNPYQTGAHHLHIAGHATRLALDSCEAEDLPTPNLLALAFGATNNAQARIAALDELARRFAADKFPEVLA